MRIAVVNETSAVDKHPAIMSALEGRGLDVVNAGMAAKGEDPELQYIQTGLISALLLAAERVDMVIGGCGTGQGYMNSVMQYPGVACGHLLTPLDAFLFARINAGNVVSLALNQGWGWAGEVNLLHALRPALQRRARRRVPGPPSRAAGSLAEQPAGRRARPPTDPWRRSWCGCPTRSWCRRSRILPLLRCSTSTPSMTPSCALRSRLGC